MGGDHDHAEIGQDHAGLKIDVPLSDRANRILAIHELLVEKDMLGPEDVQNRINEVSSRSPANGARVVARAWVDAAYKSRLLEDPRSAIAELGYSFPEDTDLVVLENTDRIHHIIVCTLCSCYPGALLGPPPDWYKSLAYRSRAVNEPRSVMREFGLELGDDVEVRVVDSSADLRYMVLPCRPAGIDDMGEEELANLVTRDSLIGVSDPLTAEAVR